MAFDRGARRKTASRKRAIGARLGCAVFAFALGACAYGTGKDYQGTGDLTDQGQSASSPPPSSSGTDAGPSSPPSHAADAGTPAPTDAGTTPPPVDAGPVTCTKTLKAGTVSLSDPVCTDINTQVTKGAVTLTYPCAGGAATATFGTQAFTGTVSATGQILVTNVSSFTLQSCHLESTQTIAGAIGTPPLAWSYGERFVSGNCSGDIICTASSKVSVN